MPDIIPKQIIEEIKYRNDIHTVISERVTLKKAGSVYLGLCPFHSEKTPSFTVFPKTASYFCFGCQAGGDVISFTMATENLTYVEALKSLADRSGIVIPEDEKEKYVSSGPSKDRILSLNKDAARFFVAELKKSREAQEYVKSRNLSPSLITHFGIGYAPNSFYALTDHLKSKGYSYEEMEAAFLSKKSEKSDKYFDLFRNRIIFPVIDTTGNVIAFGGRNITNEKPKYINTSDTPVFSKRRNVFALNFAKAHCAEKLILCEGYMDVVSLHGAGFPNSIATCGTAITPDQARLMGRYTKTVIISYDSDEAGQNAAEKAFNVLGEAGVEAKLLNMHGAKDPDEYIKKFGALSFRNLIDGSSSYFDFRLDDALSKYDVSTPDGKMKASSAILQTIIKVQSEVEREIYINRAAEKIGINADGLKYDVKRAVGKAANAAKREETEQIIRQTEGYGDRINPDRLNNAAANAAEEAILGVLATFPELIPKAADDVRLSPDDFVTSFNRRVYEEMVKYGADFDIGLLGESFSPDEISKVASYMAARQKLTYNDIDEIRRCSERLKELHEKKSLSLEELIAKKRQKEQSKRKE